MGGRLDLHTKLTSIISPNRAYFQPPASIMLTYPCIIYELSNIDSKYADNRTYRNLRKYTVTYIDENPDNTMSETLLNSFERASFDRRFVSENLYHDVITLYF